LQFKVLLAQDDGSVDEHVVIVLVVGHEAVADRQEVVVDRQESFEVSELDRWTLWTLVAADAGYCGRWLLRTLVAADAGCSERWSLRMLVAVNARRRERWSLCGEHAHRYSPLAPDLEANA
jgi:hypothetical protein